MDYSKIVIELIKHFIANEGTDYLSDEIEYSFSALSDAERAELMRLRNEARRQIGWPGA